MITMITSHRFPFRSLALIFTFFLVLSAFTINTKADGDEAVKDSDGNNVKNDGRYKLTVVGSDDTEVSVGEITRYPGSKLCWLAVIQSSSHEKGLSITIKNSFVRSNDVFTDFPVRVSFADDLNSNCTGTTQWVLVRGRASVDDKSAMMVGDNEGDEFGYNVETLKYLYVKPYDAAKHEYKFEACTYEHSYHGEICNPIGVLIDHKNHNLKRLVLASSTTSTPLVFKFNKVTTHHSGNSLILSDV